MRERRVKEIARDVFECAALWDPSACLVGNVTAAEMARLAQSVIAPCRCGHADADHYADSEARGRPCRECGCLGMESYEATARDAECPQCYGHGETAWDDTRVVRCGACGGEGKAREGGR